MPDLQGFSVTAQGSKFRIQCQLVDSQTQKVQQKGKKAGADLDFRGAKALIFPDALSLLPPAKQQELVERWSLDLIRALEEEL